MGAVVICRHIVEGPATSVERACERVPPGRRVLPDFRFRLPGAKEALLGTSFYVERGARQDGGDGTWAGWGHVAATRFEGDANGLALDGLEEALNKTGVVSWYETTGEL